jgi:hypothetical protein
MQNNPLIFMGVLYNPHNALIFKTKFCQAGRVYRHFGKPEQPKNSPPALAPFRTVLSTRDAPHFGHAFMARLAQAKTAPSSLALCANAKAAG